MITGEDPVCAEPKLFVGGLRFEVTQDELKAVFQQFGPLKSAALLTHPDTGRSKGCGMVLFGKWAHAEAAQLSLNNQVHELSNPRPLTVKFADPQRRQEDGMIVGVIPRKLFVGQVPPGVTLDTVRNVFAPFGDILDISVMPPKKDNAMGCAFVTYSSWASAENALEANNGTFTFANAQNPIAIRFADAKPADIQRVGVKRGHMDAMLGGGIMGGGIMGGMMGGGPAKRQFMMGGGGGYGMMGGGANGGMGMGMNAMMMQGMQGMMGQGMMGPGGMMGGGMPGAQGGWPPPQQPGGVGAGLPPASDLGAAGAAGQPPGMAGMQEGMAGMGGYGGGMLGGGMMQQGGMMGGNMMQQGGMMGGGMMGGGMMGGMMGIQKANLQAAKAWKLFLGQISFDLQESDLFPFFQQFGTILELALLRQPDGRHRGCGFLTYASQAEAEAAIASANGVVMPNDTRQRPMTVKYATSRAMGPAMPPGAL